MKRSLLLLTLLAVPAAAQERPLVIEAAKVVTMNADKTCTATFLLKSSRAVLTFSISFSTMVLLSKSSDW